MRRVKRFCTWPRRPETRSAMRPRRRSRRSRPPKTIPSTCSCLVDADRCRDGRRLATRQDVVPEVAGGEVVGLDLEQLGLLLATQLLGKWTARMEATSRR